MVGTQELPGVDRSKVSTVFVEDVMGVTDVVDDMAGVSDTTRLS